MRILIIFVNASGPGETLNGRAIVLLRGKELEVVVRLTRTARVAAFQREGRKTSCLMFGGGPDTMST